MIQERCFLGDIESKNQADPLTRQSGGESGRKAVVQKSGKWTKAKLQAQGWEADPEKGPDLYTGIPAVKHECGLRAMGNVQPRCDTQVDKWMRSARESRK